MCVGGGNLCFWDSEFYYQIITIVSSRNGYGLFTIGKLSTLTTIASTQRMAEVSRLWKALPQSERDSYTKDAEKVRVQHFLNNYVNLCKLFRADSILFTTADLKSCYASKKQEVMMKRWQHKNKSQSKHETSMQTYR